MNKRYIFGLCLMCAFALSLVSCLKDDDTSTTSTNNDIAVTSFSISKINRYVHTTTSAGKDTVYKTTVSSNLPVFTIDHYKKEIYNTTNLPADCDLKHVLVSIGSKNSGVLTIKSLISDTLFYYSSTDSIDFSQPRTLRVSAPDGSGYRLYTVTMNAKASTESVIWEKKSVDDALPEEFNYDFRLKKGEGNTFMLSPDGGENWLTEILGDEEDPELLPTSDITWVSFPFSSSYHGEYWLLVGTNDNEANECVVWRKIVDYDESIIDKWAYIPRESTNSYFLPRMSNLSLAWFDNKIIAHGDTDVFYESRDQGITWKASKIVAPEEANNTRLRIANDVDGHLWLLDPVSGDIWKGTTVK